MLRTYMIGTESATLRERDRNFQIEGSNHIHEVWRQLFFFFKKSICYFCRCLTISTKKKKNTHHTSIQS